MTGPRLLHPWLPEPCGCLSLPPGAPVSVRWFLVAGEQDTVSERDQVIPVAGGGPQGAGGP